MSLDDCNERPEFDRCRRQQRIKVVGGKEIKKGFNKIPSERKKKKTKRINKTKSKMQN